MDLLWNKLLVFKCENSFFLGDAFKSLIPADVAGFNKKHFSIILQSIAQENAVT